MTPWTRHACRALVLCVAITLLVGTPASAATLAAPTRLAAAPKTTSAVLSWSKVANSKTYSVCIQKSKAATSCYRTARTKLTKINFTKLAPTKGTDYFFRVTAENGRQHKQSALKGFDLLVLPTAPAEITHKASYSNVSFAWAKALGATKYSVCLLASPSATECSRRSPLSATTTAEFSGLAPTSGYDYFYRVVSHNAAGTTASRTFSFDLRVTKVTSLTSKTDGKHHLVLAWNAATNASKYGIQIATNESMTTGLVGATSTATTYTSEVLKSGMTYYVRVRGLNDATRGAFSAISTVRIGTPGVTTRVITYNLCGQDRCLSSSNGMKRWSTRKSIAGDLVRSANADFIATQESSSIDTQFGTELPGFNTARVKSAKTLFYRTSKYTRLGAGDITLNGGLKKYAVWGDFKHRATGTRFIVVDAHLHSGKGRTRDDERSRETTVLINAVKKINPTGLPVIYAGDFNSNSSNANQSRYPGGYDAPLRVFTAAGVVDSYSVSKSFFNKVFNSANQAKNPPLKNSHHVDHIFTTSDIRTLSWKILIRLSGSMYVTPFASDHNPIVADLTVPGR